MSDYNDSTRHMKFRYDSKTFFFDQCVPKRKPAWWLPMTYELRFDLILCGSCPGRQMWLFAVGYQVQTSHRSRNSREKRQSHSASTPAHGQRSNLQGKNATLFKTKTQNPGLIKTWPFQETYYSIRGDVSRLPSWDEILTIYFIRSKIISKASQACPCVRTTFEIMLCIKQQVGSSSWRFVVTGGPRQPPFGLSNAAVRGISIPGSVGRGVLAARNALLNWFTNSTFLSPKLSFHSTHSVWEGMCCGIPEAVT